MPATELAGNLLRASFQSHYNWGPSATARVDASRCRPSVWESVHYLTLCHFMSFLSIYVIPLSCPFSDLFLHGPEEVMTRGMMWDSFSLERR